MGIKSLMSAAHAAGFAMASSEDLLKSSSKSLSEIGGADEAQYPAYTYAPLLEHEVKSPSATTPATVRPIPVGRALVPVNPKSESYERLRHYWDDWVGWLSGRVIA